MSFFNETTSSSEEEREAPRQAQTPPSIIKLLPLLLASREGQKVSGVVLPALERYQKLDADERKKLNETLGRLFAFFVTRRQSRRAFQRFGLSKRQAKDIENIATHIFLRARNGLK